MSKRIRGSFKLHKYPYKYKCNKCSHEFELTKEQERYWKEGYGLFSEDPLFFICEKCHKGKATPIGFVYKDEWDYFCVPAEPSDEQKAQWDEIFGPLDE